MSGYHSGRINIIVNYWPPGYDPQHYESNLPVINQVDVTLAETKLQNIENELNKSHKFLGSDFKNGLLPGWKSTMNDDV